MADDSKKPSKPASQQGEIARKSNDGSRQIANDSGVGKTERVTDWLKPDKPKK